MKRLNIKYSIVSLLLILPLMLGAGCELLPDIELPDIGISPPSSSPAPEVTAPTKPDWTPPPAEGQDSSLPDFVSVVTKIKPSVVAINTEVVTYDIFNRPFTQERAGSGWIVDEDGYIVTNNHVVQGAESITVTLDDGRTFPASVVGTDPLTDIAVIKIDAANLVKANLGDSTELKAGEWVLAIGNSLNLGVTPSEGIVRSLGASIQISEGQTLFGLIGTSAPINPGNSGGPLVNMRGEVVGITTVKIATVGVEAMGWAISSETAMPIIEALIQNGYVIRPWLGVALYNVDQYVVLRYNLAVDKGAFVTEVAPGSPADNAGIEESDVIVSMDSKEISTAQDLILAIHSSEIGQRVEIVFWRGDTENTTYAILIERPQP